MLRLVLVSDAEHAVAGQPTLTTTLLNVLDTLNKEHDEFWKSLIFPAVCRVLSTLPTAAPGSGQALHCPELRHFVLSVVASLEACLAALPAPVQFDWSYEALPGFDECCEPV